MEYKKIKTENGVVEGYVLSCETRNNDDFCCFEWEEDNYVLLNDSGIVKVRVKQTLLSVDDEYNEHWDRSCEVSSVCDIDFIKSVINKKGVKNE